MSKLVAVNVLLSVLPSTYSEIYSEKICPLFGQILITYLKCPRASFSSSSYRQHALGTSLLFPNYSRENSLFRSSSLTGKEKLLTDMTKLSIMNSVLRKKYIT